MDYILQIFYVKLIVHIKANFLDKNLTAIKLIAI